MHNSNGEAVFYCPFCEEKGLGKDLSGHLYVNVRKGTYFCHRCHAKGSIYSLAKHLKIFIPIQKQDEQVISFLDYQQKKAFTENVNKLQKEFKPLHETDDRVQYLLKRGLTIEQIKGYNWGVIDEYPDFVFIPIVFDNYLFGFQGRSLNIEETKKRYLNVPAGMPMSEMFFNFDNAKYFSRVIITEGVFDTLSLGLRGIASFSNRISEKQFELLITNSFKEVIIAFDKDSENISIESAKRLKPYIDKVGYIKWTEKAQQKADLNDILVMFGQNAVNKFIDVRTRWVD